MKNNITLKEDLVRLNMWDNNFALGLPHPNNKFIEYLSKYELIVEDGTFLANDKIAKLFESYLVPKFGNWIAYETDNNYLKDGTYFVTKISCILVSTFNKYSKIIDYYEANYDKLLVKLSTTTTINDVPQIPDEDFTGNDYVSTIQKTETDSDSLINQLNNIRYKLVDIYNDWAAQFKNLFRVEGIFDYEN